MSSTRTDTRTYSWPPSLHHLTPPRASALPSIDEDPYAHFISPVTEEDDPECSALSLSAGIVPASPASTNSIALHFRHSLGRKWARYVSRHHSDLHELYHAACSSATAPEPESAGEGDDDDEDGDDGDGDSLEMAPRKRIEARLLGAAAREPTRGRAQDVLAEALQRRRRGRRAGRTLSGRRRSWREPSVDLFTVVEEAESAEKEKEGQECGRGKAGGEVLERSRL